MKVLLTGGSGFIAAHCINYLLQRGVRSDDKGQKILDNHPGTPKSQLSYVIVKDIVQDNAFDQAVQSDPPFEAVLHTASPFTYNVQDPKKDLLDPAVIGTTGILKAVKKLAPSVKCVVVTSSFAAMMNPDNPPKSYSENEWNPMTMKKAASGDGATAYRGSKALAERAAWEFVENEKPTFHLSTINLALVLGPIVNYLNSLDAVNTSNQRIRDMILGKFKDGNLPPTGLYVWVDVRDVALAHVQVAETKEAYGKRLFCVAGHMSNSEIAAIIRDNFPEYKDRLPAELKNDRPADVYGYDNSRSIELLGLQYRPLDKCIVDTVKSLQAAGV
ncbi:MAG: hypothetical protein Q9167_002526 [Letrouitia subvulpina]